MTVLLNTWIYFQFFLKIDLILWDKFNCNFKYIFINEIGFIKKIVLVVGQINKKNRILRGGAGLRGALRVGDGARKFSPSCEAGRGRRPHPSNSHRPITIPTVLNWF